MPQHQYQSVLGRLLESSPTVVISKAAEVMHLPNGVWSCMHLYQSLVTCFYYCFPFYFEAVRIWQHLLLCKWSVLATFFIFYDLLFYFSVCCWFCILVSGKKNCMSDWSGWAEMTAWNSYGSLNCFHSRHFLENCDKDLVTLSLALFSFFLFFFFCDCISNKYSLPAANMSLTPLKESVQQTRVLVWNGSSIGQTWQASDFSLLHAFCIVHSYAWEGTGDHDLKAGVFTICHSPLGAPAESLPHLSLYLVVTCRRRTFRTF